MTGLFDFVSYAAGLGGTKWKTFTPALLISVALSDPPIVALGAGVFSGGKVMLGLGASRRLCFSNHYWSRKKISKERH